MKGKISKTLYIRDASFTMGIYENYSIESHQRFKQMTGVVLILPIGIKYLWQHLRIVSFLIKAKVSLTGPHLALFLILLT